MSVAIVTGAEGQDASWLSELLLSKAYKVIGITRRKSNSAEPAQNLNSCINSPNFKLVYGDITDPGFIHDIVQWYRPDFYFNLAAMSHVGQSFKEPVATFNTNATAVILALEAIRQHSPETRFYQASTSELYGTTECPETGFTESHAFHPRSPYGVAKLAAFHAVVNYREAYSLHACNGILFNHSCISKKTPFFVRKNGIIDCITPETLLPFNELTESKSLESQELEIWDGFRWEKLKTITVRPTEENDDFRGICNNSCDGVIITTSHHNMLDPGGKKVKASDCKLGDLLLSGEFPSNTEKTTALSLQEAELIGFIVGDGWVDKGKLRCHLSNNSDEVVERIRYLWSTISPKGIRVGKFRYKNGEITGRSRQIFLNGFEDWDLAGILRESIYNLYSEKKVPDFILNGDKDIKQAFLQGYNMADGLKANKCIYTFKNFKTNGQQLAQGLLYLIANTTGQKFNLTVEEKNSHIYYSINMLSNQTSRNDKYKIVSEMIKKNIPMRKISRDTGISRSFISKVNKGYVPNHYRSFKERRDRNAIKKQLSVQLDYVYDLETSSGRFMAGAGKTVIANSPRRGFDFATRKITRGVAAIAKGKADCLRMGNMDAFRDEGHAKDYVRAMHMLVQQDVPKDYVVATGEGATIRQMLQYVCDLAGMDYDDVYEMDERFMRPSDVPYLKGNPSEIKALGWEPEYNWRALLKEMFKEDMKE